MQGGIYNSALFDSSQRQARQKLDQMAGIKRPSGILASSAPLMQAAMPQQKQPMMPAPAAPQQPVASMPGVLPSLPQVPMPTAVAPMAPGPRPMAQAPMAQAPMAQAPMARAPMAQSPMTQSPMTQSPMAQAPRPAAPGPVMMNEGGDVSPMAGLGGASPAMIKDASSQFVDYLRGAGDWLVEAVAGRHGSVKKAEDELQQPAKKLADARDSGSEEEVVDAALDALELPKNDEGKKEFANAFGLEDVNDIDELNRRIANVAISSTLGKGPDAFAQAMLLGLNNYKRTAEARAAAAAGGSGGQKMSPLEPFPDAVRDLAGKIMAATGGGDAADAIRQAREALAPYYNGNTPSMTVPGGDSQNLRQQLEEALKLEPERREEILKQATDMGVNTEGL